MKYAIFDNNGIPQCFYTSDIHGDRNLPIYSDLSDDNSNPEIIGYQPNPNIPSDAIEITDEQWLTFINNQSEYKWNGTGIEKLPPIIHKDNLGIISDRQFFQQLAIDETITQNEALEAVKTGTMPSSLQNAIDTLPIDMKFSAQMLLAGATTFDRNHPIVSIIGNILGKNEDQIDTIWIKASQL